MKKKILLQLLFLLHLTLQTSLETIPETTSQKSIDKPDEISIPLYLKSFDQYDCFEPSSPSTVSYDSICLNWLQDKQFSPLSNIEWGHKKLFNFFNENIYKPIAYNVKQRSSMTQVITDLYKANDSNSLLDKNNLNVNYEDFQEEILKNYKDLEKNIGFNKGADKNLKINIIDILKNFHVYWNSLRLTNEIKRVKSDTKDVMKNLLNQNEVKEKFLFDVTKTLVKKIKEAYGRFMMAHQSLEIMKNKGASIIADEVFERYKKYVEVLNKENYDYTKFVYELTIGLELSKTFFIYLIKEGKEEDFVENEFNLKIVERIKNEYIKMNSNITTNNLVSQNIKHFTVTFLLKLKHLNFIITKIKGLEQSSNADSKDIPVEKKLSVKVYYEILDNMLVLPKKCENFISLKNCLYLESNKILKYVTNKYLLKRSVSGWGLLDKIKKIFDNLNSSEIENNSKNMTMFKKYFYHNLFSMLFSYKKKYKIKDSKSLDNLENKISQTIEEFKNDNGPFKLNFELVDQLDIDVYDEILEMRANFDDFVPLNKNEEVVEKIQKLFNAFFENFLKEYDAKINLKFRDLLNILKKEVFLWKNEIGNMETKKSELNEFSELFKKKNEEHVEVKKFNFNFKKEEPNNELSEIEKEKEEEKEKHHQLEKEPKEELTDVYRDFDENDQFKKFVDSTHGFQNVPESVMDTNNVQEAPFDQHYTIPNKMFLDRGDD